MMGVPDDQDNDLWIERRIKQAATRDVRIVLSVGQTVILRRCGDAYTMRGLSIDDVASILRRFQEEGF